MTKRTPFDDALDKAIAIHAELLRAESHKKQTAEAFMRQACVNACIDAERLTEVRRLIAESGCDGLATFMRRLSSAFREPTMPCPPPASKITKIARAYGTAGLDGELAQIRITPAEAIAAAAALAVERYPDRFGSIESDWETHRADLRRLQESLNWACENLHGLWGPTDLRFEEEGKGVIRMIFRRAPPSIAIGPGTEGWARLLVQYVAALPPQDIEKAKPVRRNAKRAAEAG